MRCPEINGLTSSKVLEVSSRNILRNLRTCNACETQFPTQEN